MLWSIFESLVECGLAMEQGDSQNRVPDWRQIVHRDLKPEQIFMDTPRDDRYPDYQSVRMGDFGNAFFTSPEDPTNPRFWNNGVGTDGFLAPEQRRYVMSDTGERVDDFQLLAHTNVWGVGIIMYCLVTLEEYPVQLEYLDVEQPTLPRTRYSEDLIDLINGCLRFNPEFRQTFRGLRDSIARHTGAAGAGGNDRSEQMRSGTAGQHSLDRNRLYYAKADEYALGFRYPSELPPLPASAKVRVP